LRGISEWWADADVDLNEYADVLGRLVEGPAMSSSSGSGAARFFPLISRTGSRIVRGISEGIGLRRGLDIILKSIKIESDTVGLAAYRLLLRGESAGFSFAFPFPVPDSRKRLPLAGLPREVRALMDSSWEADEVASPGFDESRSLSWTDCCAFCLAALTLALERIGLASEVDTIVGSWFG
jgi:hypothetical protein